MRFPFFSPRASELAKEFECQKKKKRILGEIINSPETKSRKNEKKKMIKRNKEKKRKGTFVRLPLQLVADILIRNFYLILLIFVLLT